MIDVTGMLEWPMELVLFEIGVLFQVRLRGVANHASLARLSRHVHLCHALRVAESLVKIDLLAGAGWACKPTVPNEIENALGLGALEVLRHNHLWEVCGPITVVRVTLILDVGLVVAAGVDHARIALVVDDLVASSLLRLERPHVEDAAAQVLQLTIVLLRAMKLHFGERRLVVVEVAEDGGGCDILALAEEVLRGVE